MELVRGCVILIIALPFKLLTLGRKPVSTEITPFMFEGKPYLHCVIGNNGIEPITVTHCQPILDGQTVSVSFKDTGIRLPWILQRNESVGFSFDPTPFANKARKAGQKRLEVCAQFQDSTSRIYLSKPLKIYTDEKRFIRLFEKQSEPLPEPLRTIVHIAALPFFYLLLLLFPDFEL